MVTAASKRLDAEEIKKQAQGQWLNIFQAICPGMFDEAIDNLGSHVTCPLHGGEDDFRFLRRGSKRGGNTADVGAAMCTCGSYPNGLAVLMRATGEPFYSVLQMVDEYLNGHAVARQVVKPVYVPKPKSFERELSDEEILAKVNSLWAAGKPLNLRDTPYYLSRGISPRVLEQLRDVRQINSLGYYHKGERLGSYPALLAVMRKVTGEPIAVHRTWLTPDRKDKAPVPKAKKLTLSPGVSGAAIRLFDLEDSDVLGLTEGIETALAARQLAMGRYWPELGNIPVWACFAERNLRSFMLPEEVKRRVRKIVVFADNDESGTGICAAQAFKARMAEEHPELEVDIKLPPVMGWDWLDVLVNL